VYNSVGKHLKKVYSVLVKWENGKEEEVYRVQLPGPMRLGEGKPENQNHALIFTRGDGVQAIDMNQVHFIEPVIVVLVCC
jgi:callose synthase